MKVLIGVDGSNESGGVIGEAARRPWPERSEFSVVTVVDPFFFTRAPHLLEEAKKSTLESLAEQTKALVEAGWRVEARVVLDNPRHALPRVAGEWKADLILMGSHGRGAVARFLMGSTAQAVLRHATCSVEIVRNRGKEMRTAEVMRILIPTDGSECAEAALQSVADRPWPTESEFRVISCPEFPVLVGEYPYYAPEQILELTANSRKHASEAAEKGIQLLARAGLPAKSHVTVPKDSPALSILTAAEEWKADLIVVGSHGRRGFDRLVIGSVSETVALHARCSVSVIRKRFTPL